MIFKIRVLDGKTKVNLNLPIAFFKLGIKLSKSMEFQGKDITENLKNIDFDALIAMAEQGVLGKLVEVETEDGQTVEIWVE